MGAWRRQPYVRAWRGPTRSRTSIRLTLWTNHILKREGLDDSRSGQMAATLDTKLIEARWPMHEHQGVLTREETDQYPDLDDLHRRVKDVRSRQHHEYRKVEEELERSGYVGFYRIDFTVGKMDHSYTPVLTDEQRATAFGVLGKEVLRVIESLKDVAPVCC